MLGMRTVEIQLVGGDSAHREHMTRQTSRIWGFPDGLQRVITMSGWHWYAYDSFTDRGWDPQDWITTIFEFSQRQYQIQETGTEII
jgi:hypothetical protein